MDRYIRQKSLPQIGEKGQQRLREAKVTVVGAGGLGIPVLTCLALAGVGRLRVIDRDVVEESNLNRQFFYSREELGIKKVCITEKRLTHLNPDIKVEAVYEELTEGNAEKLLKDSDVVVDCVDSVKTRIAVNRACLRMGIPLVEGGISGFYGFAAVIDRTCACLECMGYTKEMEQEKIPALGATASVIGGIQAVECMKLILGKGTSLCGRMVQYDGLTGSFDEIEIGKKKDCSLHREAELL